MIRIAIQSKGRLHDETMELLTEAGIKISTSKRTLLVPAKNFALEVLFLRDDDIPEAVASGVADLGIVGLNELEERQGRADIVKPLGFSACRLSIAVPKSENYTGLEWLKGKRIATSYPEILRQHLSRRAVEADIHVISGSVEIATGIGLADAIFDIVSSGGTLASNNLREVEVVMESEAVLIAAPKLTEEKRRLLEEFVFRLEAVMLARNKKYVLMNAPKTAVSEILSVLPGIKSPTVMPLADESWCSIHTVVDEARIWEIVGSLKDAGAQGILVLPIEKIIV